MPPPQSQVRPRHARHPLHWVRRRQSRRLLSASRLQAVAGRERPLLDSGIRQGEYFNHSRGADLAHVADGRCPHARHPGLVQLAHGDPS